jgi:hypothetical protein
MNEARKKFPLASEYLMLLIIAPFGLIVMWFLPASLNLKIAFAILCFGIFFDLMSLFYHVMTIVTGKYMSGFPVIGLFFYGLFILSSQFSLVGWKEASYVRIVLYKIVDALVLLAFHICCQLPMRFQKSREHYE